VEVNADWALTSTSVALVFLSDFATFIARLSANIRWRPAPKSQKPENRGHEVNPRINFRRFFLGSSEYKYGQLAQRSNFH
jgi:hypothetical protein